MQRSKISQLRFQNKANLKVQDYPCSESDDSEEIQERLKVLEEINERME